MGAKQSSTQKMGTALRSRLQASMKQEVILPKPPTGNIYEGVSISSSASCTTGDCTQCKEGDTRSSCCKPCSLKVPANISSSSVTLSRTNTGTFSGKTKLIIKPSIPFQISYNGREEVIENLTLYHPSPVRIENVQHDAVLSIGDPVFGDRVVILIPIISSGSGRDSGDFLSKVAPYAAQLVDETTTNIPTTTVPVPTGADWNLTKIIPVGQRSIASGAFYTWNSSTLEQVVVSDTPKVRTIGWKATRGPQYILMAEPIQGNPSDLQSVFRLPPTDPAVAIHPLGQILYKNAPPPPGSCKTCGPSVAQVLKEAQAKKGAGSLSPAVIGQIIMWIFAGLAMLWALSIGLGWALDNVRGDMLRRWGTALKNAFPKRLPKIEVPAVKSPLSSKPPAIAPL